MTVSWIDSRGGALAIRRPTAPSRDVGDDAADAARTARALRHAVEVIDHLQAVEGAQQLSLLEQVGRVEAAPQLRHVGLVERLVEQQTARRERILQRAEQVALQEVQRDDHVVRADRQRFALEVDDERRDRQLALLGGGAQGLDRHRRGVDRVDLVAQPRERQRVAPVAARDVERAPAPRQQVTVLDDPGRRVVREWLEALRIAFVPAFFRAHPNTVTAHALRACGVGAVRAQRSRRGGDGHG
jgi:hypothetical protein